MFSSVMPYFTDPLIWFGIILLLLFLLIKYLVNHDIITQLPPWSETGLAKRTLKHGFLLGILVIFLGFGFKNHELNKEKQKLALNLFQTEINNNLKTIEQLSKNTQQLLESHQFVSDTLRATDSEIMRLLFSDTHESSNKVNQLNKQVEAAFKSLQESNLLKNKTAMNAFNATKNQINGTIYPVNESLKSMQVSMDEKHVIQTQIWQNHKDIIVQFDNFNSETFEHNLEAMHLLMNQYSQALKDSGDYFREVSKFIERNTFIGNGAVFRVLSKEKQSFLLLSSLNTDMKAALLKLNHQLKYN